MKTLHGDTSIERDPILIRAIVVQNYSIVYVGESTYVFYASIMCTMDRLYSRLTGNQYSRFERDFFLAKQWFNLNAYYRQEDKADHLESM